MEPAKQAKDTVENREIGEVERLANQTIVAIKNARAELETLVKRLSNVLPSENVSELEADIFDAQPSAHGSTMIGCSLAEAVNEIDGLATKIRKLTNELEN
ncbi:hypothetical protein KC963_00885 [Candidatus Saccharibacteria bacterium]|nr:hypothetical protein [Candidatus Saccharibacteria bacterium]